MKDYLTSSKAALFTYDNSKLTSMGKLRVAGRNHSRVPTHVLRDSQIQGKPPLLSGSDCVKLGMVKFRADETHSVESSLFQRQSRNLTLRPQHNYQRPKTHIPETCLGIPNQYHHYVCLRCRIQTQRCQPDLPC